MDELGGSGSSRITFGGLATGLDTNALIDALIGVERRPLELLQSRRSELTSQQSAYQDLNNRLLALRDAARAIDNRSTGLTGPSATEEFLAYSATSADESVLTAEASSSAIPGNFRVEVNALASSALRVSAGVSDPDVGIENRRRNFAIGYGDGQTISFRTEKNETLNELRDRINSAPDNDGTVRADILFDGAGHRLLISGTETGAANNVFVATTLQYQGANFIDFTAGQDATDASLEYLGVPVTRSTNDISDLVPGVTLRLSGTTEVGQAVEVDVSRDDDSILAGLQAFVDSYNSVRDFSLQQTVLDPESNRGGALIGDSLLRQVERRVQGVLGSVYSFPNNTVASLGQIGLSFDASGRLDLDVEELTAALDEDPNAVREFLSGDGVSDGAATALARALEVVVQPGDGLIATREDGFEQRIESLDRQIERFEVRLASREETLIRQFSALEALISTLQSQSAFLSGNQR